MTLPVGAKIDIEQFEAEKEYSVYGFELIELGDYINSLEEKNDLLEQRLIIERESYEQVIIQVNDLIENKDKHIQRLENYNLTTTRKNYLNYALFFAAGIGVGALF